MSSIQKFLILTLITFSAYGCNDSELIYIAKYKGDKQCALSYTFDDGLKEHYTLIAPQLDKHGLKGTFWVCGSWVNEDDSIFMGWSELKKLSEKGHEISNHSWSHACLSALSDDSIRMEVEKNDSAICSRIGVKPKTFCYPYDCVNETVFKIASENRVGTRTKIFGIGGNVSNSSAENLNLKIKELLTNNQWGVAMIHGVTHGYDSFSDPKILWDHFAQVKKMEDKIWIDTFEKISSYEQERNNTELEIKNINNTYTIIPRITTLNKNLFTEPLTMVLKKNNIKSVSIKQGGQKLNYKILSNKLIFDFNPFGDSIQVIILK